MSLLMDALRKAEDAKNKSEGGTVVENGADAPAKIDLSQVDDLELSDIQSAAPDGLYKGTGFQSQVSSAVPPTRGGAATESVTLDSGTNRDFAQTLISHPQPGHSEAFASEMTLEPLNQESSSERADPVSSNRAPDTLESSELGVHNSLEHGADLIAEFDREFTSRTESSVAPHDNHEDLATPISSVMHERASQPAPCTSFTPRRSSAEVNSPAVSATRDTSRATASSVGESPARAAAVLAAEDGERHRIRKLVLASSVLLMLALSAGGGYVFYEQDRLAVTMMPHRPPAVTPLGTNGNSTNAGALLAEPSEPERTTELAQDQHRTIAASVGAALETGTPLVEPTPVSRSLHGPGDDTPSHSDEIEHTTGNRSDIHGIAAAEKEQGAGVAEGEPSANVAARQAKPKPSTEVLRLGTAGDNATAPTLPPATPRSTFMSAAPHQQDLTHAVLLSAYGAYQRGDDDTALRLYQQALAQSPTNRDSLLGLAAVMLRKGDIQQAQSLYMEVLRAYPGDSLAIEGMLSLTATSDPVRAESEIKYLLTQNPATPHLYFLLGNVYARQNNWSEAQVAYFNAYRLDNRNADYSFNLAVALDRIGAHSQALSYYQTALQLASNGSASFDLAAVNQRLHRLERQVAKGTAP